MEQTANQTASEVQAAALSKSWTAWETYYKEASRRRRAMGARRSFRDEKRYRRVRERIALTVSAGLIGGLTLFFYVVLTHR
jgi:hypothetical protein